MSFYRTPNKNIIALNKIEIKIKVIAKKRKLSLIV